MANQSVVIFDLDGTVCDTRHRLHHLLQEPKDWGAWNAACSDDTPHVYVVELARMLQAAGVTIVVCSSRLVSLQRETMVQLATFQFPYSLLMMRKVGDTRPDTVIKLEMLRTLRCEGAGSLDIKFAVDDRPEVVQMWRDNGVPCFVVEQADWIDQVCADTRRRVLDEVQMAARVCAIIPGEPVLATLDRMIATMR